ncbi:3-oxoacyl-ACP reductase FabG [Parafilimonas terrae]|uniref:3-oxoacyl-[acyl-carrier protein] reductase n=1 Tax=Parafilimonas terrae TaxID=1465490 RepID=A0A1I5Z7D7_9BACT|nr:3-oxoacyl-ACP reductase FabG [Parafilimonas terrae]SFQ52361.1 3-oxoacyl-[acyl-carrier protein] reductase [Parafilimonas terrae]
MKSALVTGGSRGIGKAVCIKLAEMGYHVIINYRSNEDEARKTLQAVEEKNATGELLQFDVADKEAIKNILGEWIEKNTDKSIEVLVNNAGIRDDALMFWMNDAQWDNVVNTSLGGFFYVTRIVLNSMLQKRYGRIINIVSLSGIKGMPGQVNYSAAKAGIIGATKALAQEVGKRNITVNAIAPGFIKTDMTQDLDESQLKSLIPVNRFGTPEEVAYTVGFLAAPQAAYITGEVISVNGGLHT